MSAFEFAPAPPRRRKLPREAAVAIGVSLLVHVGVVGYIATQKFAEIRLQRDIEPDPIIIQSFKRVPPPPPKSIDKVVRPRPIDVHDAQPIVDPLVPPL